MDARRTAVDLLCWCMWLVVLVVCMHVPSSVAAWQPSLQRRVACGCGSLCHAAESLPPGPSAALACARAVETICWAPGLTNECTAPLFQHRGRPFAKHAVLVEIGSLPRSWPVHVACITQRPLGVHCGLWCWFQLPPGPWRPSLCRLSPAAAAWITGSFYMGHRQLRQGPPAA
jgi:hypothetical protein